MNYRHKLLNQQNKNQITQLETKWQQEKNILQQDIINLQNSTDIKLLEQAQEKSKELEEELQKEKDLLNKTINLLGASDIKNLTDLSNLLQGKTLKELVNEKELNHSLLAKKITDLETQLLTLAKQKIKGKKDAESLLNKLETNWKRKEENYLKVIQEKKEVIEEQSETCEKQKASLDHQEKTIKDLQEDKKKLAISFRTVNKQETHKQTQRLEIVKKIKDFISEWTSNFAEKEELLNWLDKLKN